jgi:hypothetical protein
MDNVKHKYSANWLVPMNTNGIGIL